MTKRIRDNGPMDGDSVWKVPEASEPSAQSSRLMWLLFLASFFALYFEMVVIRYLSTEVRVFAYLKNLPLIASFLGLGVGMILGQPSRLLKRSFPFVAAFLILVIAYAPALHLVHIQFPNVDYFVWAERHMSFAPVWELVRYFLSVTILTGCVVAFFLVPGGIVGQYMSALPSLKGYGVNLAGSLAGILFFTAVCFLGLPPWVWILLGFLAAVPFFLKDRVALGVFAVTVLAMVAPQPNNYWSPYYHIILEPVPIPQGWSHPSAFFLTVNHDYHQKMLDLSPDFVSRFPGVEPNRSGLDSYSFPYRLAHNPQDVLVVGAGTGNDVAAALRNGAAHVDAVEIDPVILRLGRTFHPEHPYDSPRVTAYNDDARAFFQKAKRAGKSYDLIVFGYLDSHTLLTSFSSLRLDNYVYTLESMQEARALLRDSGTMVLGFASGRTFVTGRLFSTIERAFGTPPRAFMTGYDGDGVVLVEGGGRATDPGPGVVELTSELEPQSASALISTDSWPFLYLAKRTIPIAIFGVLFLFLIGADMFLRHIQVMPRLFGKEPLHFLFLGAGFLLLETKSVTELSLLFGSTWVVNAVVIATFLAAGLAANSLVMLFSVSRRVLYLGLFVALGLGVAIPCSHLAGYSLPVKLMGAAVLAGLPVFFSGMIFSSSFAEATKPAEALGVNLLGAVIGGALENLVMIWGIPFLGFLALFLYAFSAAAVGRWTAAPAGTALCTAYRGT